ncbi:MAG: hypothetical protein OXF05_00045 [Hyphomicrobiales bacterium]|nr:hypothetical protein [Hyphomicrobiales bacterium]MCY4033296.1 hypothetical protein [Hyphomicrobiales bacterium]MCY4039424.1 hypothetical protein [Hyphomicrobiales bacterium]
MERRKGFVWIALPAFLILCALGFWQLERHKQKQEYSARLESQTNVQTSPLPSSNQWDAVDVDAWEHRKVQLQGVFDPSREVYWFNHREIFGAGFDILTPLRLRDGGWVVVNRGFIATPSPPQDTYIGGSQKEITLTGSLRKPATRRWFDPANDVDARLWVVRDLAAMASWMDIDPVAPWFVHAESPLSLDGAAAHIATPIANPVRAPVRRVNHIAYAVTWFAMAVILAVMFIVYIRREE